jgi:hypothetical protein
MTDQLNNRILKSGKYEQYKAIAHENKKVEKANLNGLYQAFTPYTCVSVIRVRTRNRIENPRHAKP